MSAPTEFVDATAQAGGRLTPAGSGAAAAAPMRRAGARVWAWAWVRASVRSVVYSLAVFAWSIVGLTVLVTGLSVSASLLVLVVGVFVWVGFVHVTRWTTWVDRRLAGWVRHEPVPASYRRSPEPGLVPAVRTVTTDPQTWRDMAWLAVTSLVGFAAGLAVVTAAGVSGAYLSMPLWYWTIGDPAAHRGLTNVGLFTVDSLGRAALVALAGVVSTAVTLLLARGCAALHARLAVLFLSPRSPS